MKKGEVRILSYHVGYKVDEPAFVVDLETQAIYRSTVEGFRWTICHYIEDTLGKTLEELYDAHEAARNR